MAIPPVVIQFLANGVPDVSRALRSIGDIVARTETQATGASRVGANARIREATREAQEKARQAARAEAMISAAQRAGNREVEARARADLRAATNAANEKIRLAQRVAAEEARLRGQVVRANLQRAGFRNASASNPSVVDALVPRRGGAGSADLDALRAIRAQQKIDAARDASTARDRKSADKAAAAKQRSAEKEATAKIAAMKVADREAKRAQEEGLRVAERTENARVRAAEKAEREKNRDAARWLRRREAEERDATRRRHDFARSVVGGVGSSLRAAGGMAVGGARMLTQLGGGFSIADAVQDRMKAQGLAADIANSGYQPNGDKAANRVKVSSSSLLDKATVAGTPYGFSQTETLTGLSKFTSKTGDLDTGTKLLPQLAQMARATGSSFDDLADAAGDVFNSDTKQSAEDVLAMMRIISAQGKLGAVEIKDLASQMAKLGAAAGQFGKPGETAEMLAQFGAMAQVTRAKGGAASATQAATAVGSFTNTFSKGARLDAFENMGVKVRDDKGNLFSPQKIITDSLQAASSESHGGMAKFDRNMGGMFMDVQARRVTKGFEKIYKDAGGGKAGVDAVNAEFARMKASQTQAEIQQAAADRMAEADMQFTKAVLELKEATSKELIPAFTRIVPDLVRLTPMFGQLAREGGKLMQQFTNLAASNPLGGLGVLLGLAITKEVGAAGLGKIFEMALASKLGGQAGLVVGSAVLAIALATMAIDKMASDERDRQNVVFKDRAEATNALSELRQAQRSGNVTPQQLDKAKAAQEFLAKEIEQKQGEVGGSNVAFGASLVGAVLQDAFYNRPKQLINGQTGADTATDDVINARTQLEANDRSNIDSMKQDFAELTKALNENTRVTRQNTGAGGGSGGGAPASPVTGPITTRIKPGP